MTRLEKTVEALSSHDLGELVVSNICNVRYLSGFSGSTAWMHVSPDTTTLITDFRYQEQAENEVYDGIKIKVDNRDALTVACEMIADHKGRIGFESGSITYASYEKLRSAGAADFVPLEGLIESQRKRKDDEEITKISKAVDIADEVLAEIVEEIRQGMTEIDLAARIDFLLRKKSGNVPAFETISASGENSSLPHATPMPRVIKAGDLVKMDFGAVWQGYCSDLTRTVVVGKASDEQKKVHKIVREAQARAIDGIRAGLKCSEADSLARDHIKDKGYGERFGHSLGHGVGIEVHEGPRLSCRDDSLLESGMVVTVEPGIYIAGWGGVRIEDMLVVEDSGCRVLTSSDKNLLEVGS